MTDGLSEASLDPYFLVLGLKAVGGLVLVVFLFQLIQPELNNIKISLESCLYAGIVSVILLFLVHILPESPYSVLLLLLASGILAIKIDRSIPATFLLAPTDLRWALEEPSRAKEVPVSESGTDDGRPVLLPGVRENTRPSYLLEGVLFRSLLSKWNLWLCLVLTFLYSLLLSDAYRSGQDALQNVLFVAVWSFSIPTCVIANVHRIDHLPISRARIFPYVLLPVLLPILLGVGLGTVFFHPAVRTDCQLCYGRSGPVVPAEFWRISWDGLIPEIISPWGEAVTPRAYPIFPGGQASVFLPFEAPEASTSQFHAFQLNRALKAVHSQSPYSEERIVEGTSALVGRIQGIRDREELVSIEESRGLGSDVRFKTWALGSVFYVLFWGALLLLTVFQYMPSGFGFIYRVLHRSLLIITVGALLVYLSGDMLEYAFIKSAARVPIILLRELADQFGISPGMYILASLLLLVAVSLSLFYAFKSIEVPLRETGQRQ